MLNKFKHLTLAAAMITATSFASAETNAALTPAETQTVATIAQVDINEILASEVALNKTSDAGVKDFANLMIEQHSKNLTEALGMTQARAFVKAHHDGTAKKLTGAGLRTLAHLGNLSEPQFDHTFVNGMVKGHKEGLELIDTQLMKTATSAEMKTFMTQTRAMVAEHLAHGKALQAKMKGA